MEEDVMKARLHVPGSLRLLSMTLILVLLGFAGLYALDADGPKAEQNTEKVSDQEQAQAEKTETEEDLPSLKEEIEVKAQADRPESTTVLTQQSLKGEPAFNLNDYLLIG